MSVKLQELSVERRHSLTRGTMISTDSPIATDMSINSRRPRVATHNVDKDQLDRTQNPDRN